MIYSETIVPGRIAMGEMFDFDICYLKTQGKINNQTKFRDSSLLSPKNQKIQSLTMFDDKTILTSLYLLTKKDVVKTQSLITEMFSHTQNMSAGCSILPNDSGLSIRILGNSSEDQKTIIHEILKIIRHEILPDYL